MKTLDRYPDDSRDRLWAKIESDIQKSGPKKDRKFELSGKWKHFVRAEKGFKVYAVKGDWVRNNLSVTFGHGGHGLVHEFIPHDEIWIDTHHFKGCGCVGLKRDRKVSENYFESCIHHEIVEYGLMKKGMIYWKAHHNALEAERKLGLLKNPVNGEEF